MLKILVWRSLRRFVTEQSGGITILSLYIFLASLVIGGIALDVTRLQAEATLMQVTADNAAHAALIRRRSSTEPAAKLTAVAIAQLNMPQQLRGNVLTSADVQFGTWNAVTRQFVARVGAVDAVRVSINRQTSAGNPLPTLLLGFVGIDHFDLTRTATVIDYDPGCLREGFVSDTMVDMQSNNAFLNGFCIHSNQAVKISTNNTFDPTVSVSMPSLSNLQLPSSGFNSNPGLQDALDTNRYDLRVLTRLNATITGLTTPGSRYVPAYITSTNVLTIGRNVSAATVTAGRIHRVTCAGSQTLSIANGTVLNNVVIVTNCRVSFGNGAALQNVVIATTNTDDRSFNGPNGVRIGLNDNCARGGGAQLLTMGGMDFASGLEVYGGQLLAQRNISFSASATGLRGASFVAHGTISGTSGMTMSGCGGNGMEDNFRETYVRLVE